MTIENATMIEFATEYLEESAQARNQMPSLLSVMLQAPAAEIDDMCVNSSEAAAKVLGIEADEYNYETHYVLVVARLRRRWAEAMIEEALRAVDQK